jgi:hypothetical protein
VPSLTKERAEQEAADAHKLICGSEDDGFLRFLASNYMSRGRHQQALQCLQRLTVLAPGAGLCVCSVVTLAVFASAHLCVPMHCSIAARWPCLSAARVHTTYNQLLNSHRPGCLHESCALWVVAHHHTEQLLWL